MQDAIIYIDPESPMNLQNQIRQKLVDGILNGAFPPGMKLPSSRKLAQQLHVARNTVVAAYQQSIAHGYLVSRKRSEIFVNEWSTDSGDADDAMLIDEIRTKILTRRGIQAGLDEILITMGTQNDEAVLSCQPDPFGEWYAQRAYHLVEEVDLQHVDLCVAFDNIRQ